MQTWHPTADRGLQISGDKQFLRIGALSVNEGKEERVLLSPRPPAQLPLLAEHQSQLK